MFYKNLIIAALLGMACSSGFSAVITIQPGEAQSKDAFVYQGLASTFNSDTYNSGEFKAVLSSGATGSGHDTHTYVQFDLSTIPAGGIANATLNLYVNTTGGNSPFGGDPTSASPVVANVHKVTADWTEGTMTWANAAAFSATVAATRTVNGTGAYFSFDVTALVQEWHDGISSNFGFMFEQAAVVVDGLTGAKNVVVYDSASGAHTPFLTVTPAPEPASLGLLSVAAFTGCMRRQRKRALTAS